MSVPESAVPTPKGTGSITVASATAIGVGGMMGAGLYTLAGLASTTAGVWVPMAFLVGGAVTVFSVYSYAKLGAKYPSRGGPRSS
jgi:amino acid transporter